MSIIDYEPYVGVLFAKFSFLEEERHLFDRQSDSLAREIGYQQAPNLPFRDIICIFSKYEV